MGASVSEPVTVAEHPVDLDEVSSLPELFRKVAAVRGTAEALRDNERTFSYRDVDLASDRLASRLVREGVRRGDRVGILLHRSAELSISIIAVLKAGAAYVPLEPSFPDERLRLLISDAGITVVVGNPESASLMALTGTAVIPPDAGGEPDGATAGVPLDGTDLAYIMYTSGSTGTPKGCMLTHRCVVELLRSIRKVFNVGPRDRITQFHPFIFDASVLELWLTMAAGATSVVVPLRTAESAEELVELLERERITLLSQVPTVFRSLLQAYEDADRPELSLRYLILGGERVDLEVVSSFLDVWRGALPTVVNVYGPTETTCITTCHVLSRDDLDGRSGSPIGSALAHAVVEVRGERMEPLADGQAGEIVIAGPALAEGYLGRPDLTAERFVLLSSPQGARRYYRSGDIARRLPDGSFEYLGRGDDQVKVRGARVELGEVESVLQAHPLVTDAAVTVVDTSAGAQFFVACVVLADGAPAHPERVLREYMRDTVPRFMAPDRYHFIDDLPLTASGKCDRRALREIAVPRRRAASNTKTG